MRSCLFPEITYRGRRGAYRCRSPHRPRGSTAAGRTRTSPPSATACSGCGSCEPGKGGGDAKGVARDQFCSMHMIRFLTSKGYLEKTMMTECFFVCLAASLSRFSDEYLVSEKSTDLVVAGALHQRRRSDRKLLLRGGRRTVRVLRRSRNREPTEASLILQISCGKSDVLLPALKIVFVCTSFSFFGAKSRAQREEICLHRKTVERCPSHQHNSSAKGQSSAAKSSQYDDALPHNEALYCVDRNGKGRSVLFSLKRLVPSDCGASPTTTG